MRRIAGVGLMLGAAAVMWAESAAGVRWTAAASWKAQPEKPMRAATYAVPAAHGDPEDGECGIYYFGKGQGGSVDANVKRWAGQFEQPEHPAEIKKLTIHGLSVTTIDVSGTYTGAGGPMAASKSSKPGYRLLGAIVEAPEGLVFMKFTGPAKTVAANHQNFENLLHSITPEK